MTDLLFKPNQLLHTLPEGDNSYILRVFEMFFAVVNAQDAGGKYLFVTSVLIPLLRLVFTEGNTAIPSDEQLVDWSVQKLRDFSCEFRLTKVYPQVDVNPPKPIIYWNSSWLKNAQGMFTAYQTNLPPKVEIERAERKFAYEAHLTMGVIKLLHKFAHTLTPSILQYEFEQKSFVDAKAKKYELTPTKVGIKFINQVVMVGDMGYALEELLLGNGLRIKMECNLTEWHPTGLYFEKANIVHQQVTSTQKSGEIKQVEKDDFVQQKVTMAFSQAIKYTAYLFERMESYLSPDDTCTAEELYAAFNPHTCGATLQAAVNIFHRLIPEEAKERKRTDAECIEDQLYLEPLSTEYHLLLTSCSGSSSSFGVVRAMGSIPLKE